MTQAELIAKAKTFYDKFKNAYRPITIPLSFEACMADFAIQHAASETARADSAEAELATLKANMKSAWQAGLRLGIDHDVMADRD